MIICPKCKISIEDNDVFCSNCGYNLITDSIVKQANEIVKKPMNLDADTMSKYLELEKRINDLKGVEQELQQQESYLINLNEMFRVSQQRLNELSVQQESEYKDVKKLQDISITSIFARIKGNREERLEKEELEYLNILNKEEASKNEVNDLGKKIRETQQQISELKHIVEHKNNLKAELESLIYEVCAGVTDPIEDQIEEQLRNLIKRFNPIIAERSRLIRGQGHINNAKTYLESALDLISSAKGYSDWDTFFGGGFFVDSIKHSRMADARNNVQRAQNEIYLANNEIPTLPLSGQEGYVEELSFFWDGFMDNIFSDFSARGKIQRSRESVRNELDKTIDALNWIENQKISLNSQINELEKEIELVRVKLLSERKRMIEEVINKKH